MEKKIRIPEKVDIKIDKKTVEVSGPKGTLKKDFNNPRFNRFISIEKAGNEVIVKTDNMKRKNKALVGTIASHIRNMVLGVTVGFKYEMKIIYTHFPVTVSAKDGKIEIKNFLGEKGTRNTDIVGNAEVKIEKDIIIVTGNSIEDVSQTAANIERATKFSGRDRRIFVDGIYISGKFLQSGEPL